MKIELLDNPDSFRQKFIDSFLEPKTTFKAEYKEFVEQLKDFDEWYEQSYMWDKLPCSVPIVKFAKALELLKSFESDVFFMSECKGFRATCHLTVNGENIEGFVGKANAHELADRIFKVWYEDSRMTDAEDCYLEEFLPFDLYVFDETYKWFIVFTHETDDCDADAENDWSDNRFCRAYGLI